MLVRAEAIWSARPGAGSARRRLSATSPKAVAYDVPPVVLTLEPVALVIEGHMAVAGVTARLYDFGVLTLALRVPAADLEWAGFAALVNAVDAAVGPGAEHPVWRTLREQVCGLLGAALERPTRSVLEEDYLIGLVRGFDRAMGAAEIQERLDLVPLLSGEDRALSEVARQDLLGFAALMGFGGAIISLLDRAFLYEPHGDSDVLDVLEVANAQLLEVRYYDELLDDELPRMYDLVERTRRGGGVLSSRRFARLARRLCARFLTGPQTGKAIRS